MDVPVDVQCSAGQQVCGSACSTLADDPLNCGACGTVCPRTQVCVAGACRQSCPSGQQLCGDRCVSVDTDRAHCGACGNACGRASSAPWASAPSTAARCWPSAPGAGDAGTDGGGARYCANVSNDRENCGACGVSAPRVRSAPRAPA
jgi:hypothetical protein